MRRELKDYLSAVYIGLYSNVTRHIPMRRELKAYTPSWNHTQLLAVTRHIPMRRELKGYSSKIGRCASQGHKAYPDEKGTERSCMW
jgi:hypothetical protein